ncbi:hypothetical protein [Halorubellus sp. PRR65]|uniref:hypothetical protein n=1 Tax=Halorubellus sp. PRR65 TaxID=3098148 RepID=UPI002B258E9E|nr:hypothetical protein [Halorubellus sp. PRR65]
MVQFEQGDRVRVDIPDETDPDHDTYHGVHGTVVDHLEDEAGQFTGDDRHSTIYRLELETGEQVDFRYRDLRPAIE